jgi:hypothetical protein
MLRSRFRQDKGHRAEWQAFAKAIQQGAESPIPFDQIVTSMLATLRAVDSRCQDRAMIVDSKTLDLNLPATETLSGALKLESC